MNQWLCWLLLSVVNGAPLCPAAALAQRMALPQTACLALSGPLEVPETDGGHAWFTAFDDFGELIQVRVEMLVVLTYLPSSFLSLL